MNTSWLQQKQMMLKQRKQQQKSAPQQLTPKQFQQQQHRLNNVFSMPTFEHYSFLNDKRNKQEPALFTPNNCDNNISNKRNNMNNINNINNNRNNTNNNINNTINNTNNNTVCNNNDKAVLTRKPPFNVRPRNIFSIFLKSSSRTNGLKQGGDDLQEWLSGLNDASCKGGRSDSVCSNGSSLFAKKKNNNRIGSSWFSKRKMKSRSHSANSVFEVKGASSDDLLKLIPLQSEGSNVDRLNCRSNSLFRDGFEAADVSFQL